jgi:chemotaxis regulatin CheY-phosphate phosphatase CheZ
MRDGSQKIPSASNNLQFVSKTTEMATHEILDQLELVTQKVNEIKEELNKEGSSEKILKHIESLEKKTSDIFLSFQFQDITNQQLEYVNRILQAIYQKFIELFDTSLKVRARTLFGQDLVLAIEKELQKRNGENALQKFNNVTTDIVRHNGVSQEAIDKYFTEK